MGDDLDAKLTAIEESAVVRPNADPQASAVTALLVGDWLLQPDVVGKLSIPKDRVKELKALARKILVAMEALGGEYLDDSKPVPGEVIQRGISLREQMLSRLEQGLPHEKEVIAWLDAIRLGQGVVDLVYDLRTLADLHKEHDEPLSTRNLAAPNVVASARSTADSIEYALRAAERPDQTKFRLAVARAWTLFQPGYEAAAAAGRALGDGHEKKFPPLGLIASYRRGRRRAVSLVPVAPAPPPSVSDPSPPSVVTLSAADQAPSPTSKGGLLSPMFTAPQRPSGPESRRAHRAALEIEIGFASETNFYAGFTENLSANGVFVATYSVQPIHTKLEVQMTLPTGEELKLHGVVRWSRAGSTESWPGMGIQFTDLSPDDEAKIRKFLSVRAPMFYDV